MNGNSVSRSGKNGSEDKMTSMALIEAKSWAEELMDSEFRGRGDREKSARYRLSKKTGVPESYLFRLQYKTAEMKDVAGSVYRALMIAYDAACRANEEAADKYRAQRLGLRGQNEKADKRAAPAAVGMDSPKD